jgi:predicted transcriptional regulator of viral defense system
MVLVKKILSKVSEWKTVEAVSKELDVREPTLRAMIDFMIEKGYLEEIKGGELDIQPLFFSP